MLRVFIVHCQARTSGVGYAEVQETLLMLRLFIVHCQARTWSWTEAGTQALVDHNVVAQEQAYVECRLQC
jgi:hypothetical protein